MDEAVSDRDYSRHVMQRLHAMARVRICRGKCRICCELPRHPVDPTPETNVLLAMRQARIREEAEREAMLAAAPGAAWAIAEGQVRNLPPSRADGTAWTHAMRESLTGSSTKTRRQMIAAAKAEAPRSVCPVPVADGIVWAAVQRLVAHAFSDIDTMAVCGKRSRREADFGRTTAPNWCRDCQVAVLRRLGRNVYLAGNAIRERVAAGTRKLAKAERSR